MKFEDIGRVWREEGTGAIRRTRVEDLSLVVERARTLGAARRRRFARLVWLAAVPMILFYGYMAWQSPNLVAALGALLMAGFGVVVAIIYRAIGRGPADAALPVRLALQAEVTHLNALARLRREAKWLRTLFWVGYGIYCIGVFALEEGGLRGHALAVGLLVTVPLVVEGLIRIGRRRTPSVPATLRAELESWLESLDELDAREGADQRHDTVDV